MNNKEYRFLKTKLMDYDAVCFDFFDTIVYRKKSPNYLFRVLSNHLIQNYFINITGDELYNSLKQFFTLVDVDSVTIFKNIYYHYSINKQSSFKDFYNEMYSLSIEYEINNVTIANNVVKLITYIKEKRKPIYVVSDYFFGKVFLEKIVTKIFRDNCFDDIFVSCDLHVSKSNCKLYEIIRSILPNKKMIMIGDNYVLDFLNSQKFGFDSYRLNSHKEYIKYEKYDKKYNESNYNLLKRMMINNKEFYSTNYIFLIFDFCKRLYKEVGSKQCIYFLAREGQFLKTCFDKYLNNYNFKNLSTEYLPISRIAVFLAANVLPKLELKEALIKINSFLEWKIQTFREFLQYIGFNKSEIVAIEKEHGINREITIDDQLVVDVWNDKCFKSILANKGKQSKEKLFSYINFRDNKIILVDVGWHGTMQNLVRKLLPNKIDVIGYYIGTFQTNNESENSIKKGLLFDCFSETLYFKRSSDILVLEALLRANHGQLISYRMDEEDLYINDGGLEVYNIYSKQRQEIMLNTFCDILEHDCNNPIFSETLKTLEEHIIIRKPYKTKVIDNFYEHYQCYGNKNCPATYPRLIFLFIKYLSIVKRIVVRLIK